MCRDLEYLRHSMSSVYIRTTRDMNYLPFAQDGMDLLSLRSGRFINYDDNANARRVVVIHRHFAERRQIGVGDTITVTVGPNQHLVYSPYLILGSTGDMNPYPVPIMSFPELGILSIPNAGQGVTLELEIVGIYDLLRWAPIGTRWSSINKFMYIPDSLLPADWGLQTAYFGDIAPSYTPATWFSFVLADQRDREAFLLSTRDALGVIGFRVSFFGREEGGFWEAANIITLSSAFNLIMFAVVLVLVFILTIALFMWQRNREYAILRSLGCSVGRNYIHSTLALLLIGLPSVFIGSFAGRHYAEGFSASTIAGFSEIVADAIGIRFPSTVRNEIIAYYMEASLPSVSLLAVVILIILLTMFVIISIINLLAARRSVIEILRRTKL